MVTGFPSTITDVTVLPCVLATTSVFPEDDGVGFSRSISMQSLPFLISTFMAMMVRFFVLCMQGINIAKRNKGKYMLLTG